MKISVITPVYNAAPYVEESVLSALAQPQTAEVILIEDGSPDNSLEICVALAKKHSRVRLLRHPDEGNHGAGASRNIGITNAKFDFVAFLDADDFFLPDRFRKAQEILEDNPDLDGVYEAVSVYIDNRLKEEQLVSSAKPDLITMKDRVPPEKLFEALVTGGKGAFSTDGVVVRTSVFNKTGLFDEHLIACQDTAMWVKMAAVGRLAPGCLDQGVACARVHSKNRVFGVAQSRQLLENEQRLFETLWAWGKKAPLTPDRRSLLLFVAIFAALRGTENASLLKQLFLGASILLSKGWRHPRAFLTPCLWQHILQRLGHRMLRGRWSK